MGTVKAGRPAVIVAPRRGRLRMPQACRDHLGDPRLFRYWRWVTTAYRPGWQQPATGGGSLGFCGSRRVRLPPAVRPWKARTAAW